MAFYTPLRPNASKHDLTQEGQQEYIAIQTYAANMGANPRPLTETVIVDLMQRFGAKQADYYVKCFINRSFRALGKLQDIIDGKEGPEYKPPQEAQLKRKKSPAVMRLSSVGYTEEERDNWMRFNGPGEPWESYFTFSIVQGVGGRYFKKKEAW